MTKAQIIRALDPFEDDIEITVRDRETGYLYNPSIYYVGFTEVADAKLVIGASKPENEKKWVELKV